MTPPDHKAQPANRRLSVEPRDGSTLLVHLTGRWSLEDGLESTEPVGFFDRVDRIPDRVEFDSAELSDWDSSLLIFLRELAAGCREKRVEMDTAGLPEAAQRLLDLACTGSGDEVARRKEEESVLAEIGEGVLVTTRVGTDALAFIGEVALAFLRLPLGKTRFRRSDLLLFIQKSGAEALPIVTLISFLVGAILAFVGAVQLEQFGAQIFVANLVAIGMVREMGALMTAIIMAGRTGTAFAANLGTMVVNEEINALRTTGISPIDFLVVPRIIALVAMMPLLCLYSDLLGIIGGATVGLTMLDITLTQYIEQSIASIELNDVLAGLIKATAFGVVVAVAGCLQGMHSGRSAAAVGDAATKAAVTSILFLVIVDSVLTVIYTTIGF
jgi:phospholipid/cholesterol/gamma-HCH transport system permease protein